MRSAFEAKLAAAVTKADATAKVYNLGNKADVLDVSKLAFPMKIMGNGGDDKIRGGKAVNIIFGGAGNDDLKGGPADDYIAGGSGNDTILQSFGSDILKGNDGNDIIGNNPVDQGGVHPYWSTVEDGGKGRDFLTVYGNGSLYGGEDSDAMTANSGHCDKPHPQTGVAMYGGPKIDALGRPVHDMYAFIANTCLDTTVPQVKATLVVTDFVPGDVVWVVENYFSPAAEVVQRSLLDIFDQLDVNHDGYLNFIDKPGQMIGDASVQFNISSDRHVVDMIISWNNGLRELDLMNTGGLSRESIADHMAIP